jgi:phosphinothricin acetyltransferase
MPKLPVTLRPATPEDIPSVCEIHKYYVVNTVITFVVEPVSVETHTETLKKVQAQNLPYIVAVSENANIVGYSYLNDFRGSKGGYRHTVELSLFCHPDYLYQGIGSALLSKVLQIAVKPEDNIDFVTAVRPDPLKIRHIIAVMAIDTDSKEEGMGLKNYYESFGFVLNGHLKQVGYKLDRWLVHCAVTLMLALIFFVFNRIDTMYLQKTLW